MADQPSSSSAVQKPDLAASAAIDDHQTMSDNDNEAATEARAGHASRTGDASGHDQYAEGQEHPSTNLKDRDFAFEERDASTQRSSSRDTLSSSEAAENSSDDDDDENYDPSRPRQSTFRPHTALNAADDRHRSDASTSRAPAVDAERGATSISTAGPAPSPSGKALDDAKTAYFARHPDPDRGTQDGRDSKSRPAVLARQASHSPRQPKKQDSLSPVASLQATSSAGISSAINSTPTEEDGSYFGSSGSRATAANTVRDAVSCKAQTLDSGSDLSRHTEIRHLAQAVASTPAAGTSNTDKLAGPSHDAAHDESNMSILSPALSTSTTLSAGVSLGATMGGNERIFPIRSVVKSHKDAPASSGTTSSPTSVAISQSHSGSAGSASGAPFGSPPLSIGGGNKGRVVSGGSPRMSRLSLTTPPANSFGARLADAKRSDEHYEGQAPDASASGDGASVTTRGEEYQRRSPIPDEASDFSFGRDRFEKPAYNRLDSNASALTGSVSHPGSDPRFAPTLASHPTTVTSYSDDSDPTARNSSSQASTDKPGQRRTTSHTSTQHSDRSALRTLEEEGKLDDVGEDPTKRAALAAARGEAEAGPSVDTGALGSLGTQEDGVYLNFRFEHQQTEDGHVIVTGRQGGYFKCEDEPIHIPGAIQDFGVLMAMEADGNGKYPIVQVSENSCARLGLPPKFLFTLSCFTEVLDEDQADAFLEAMEMLEESATDADEQPTASTSADATSSLAQSNHFQLSGQGALGTGMDGEDSRLEWTCWCAVHKPDPKNRPGLLIVEFEIEHDIMNPVLRDRTQDEIDDDRAKEQSSSLFGDTSALPGLGRADGEVNRPDAAASSLPGMVGKGGNNERGANSGESLTNPNDTGTEGLGNSATQDEIESSTISRVKPIRALRRLRKSSKGGADIMKLFGILGQINDELAKTEDLQTSLEIATGVVAEITGFHRVMIYQFDENWNGQVVAELVDYKQTRDLYRGLHFPASDIPAQARELYKINKVRLLYDRDQPTARLVCRSLDELKKPLNLTHAHLRAMSPIHIKYLANMGVRASMSISIIAFGQLWGLISCHTYGRYGQRVSFPGRQLCRIIGDSISRNIERLSYAQRLQSRKLINTIPTNSNPGGYIIAKAEDLLTLFDADFGVLSIGDEAKILGSLDNSQEVLAILEYLRIKVFQDVQVSTNVMADYPDLDYPAGLQQVSGMLMVPLAREGQDFIAFFRRGQLEHVHWAGNPYDKVMRSNKGGKLNLEPRKSFKIWSETVVGKSRMWNDENIETASVLRLVYGKFIEVWRQREAALTSSKLTSLLLSNASHEVRTPLNHIINYLEMALEGPLDDDTRESLVRSHSASRALVHVINDLLDLTRTQTGQPLFLQDPLDLSHTIDEAVAIHRFEAQRKGIAFEVIENPSGTPQTLLGDRGKIRQIVANVTANAVKHTHQGKVTVEWGELPKGTDDIAEASQDTIKIGIAVSDTGIGIPELQLEDMFRTFEQVEAETPDKQSGGNLGLGLAVVARIVSHLGGQLRVESKVGHGSKFTFVLHFRLPGPESTPRRASMSSSTADDSSLTMGEEQQQREAGQELGAHSRRNSGQLISQSGSGGSKGTSSSMRSARSRESKKSEIDSLVQAIGGDRAFAKAENRTNRPGVIQIGDSGTPLRPVKVDETEVDVPHTGHVARPRVDRRQTTHDGQSAFAQTGFIRAAQRRMSSSGKVPKLSGTSSSSAQQAKPLRIMIVEDDAINRAILMKKLKKDFNHDVKSTVHGEDAVRLYSADNKFDIILMDLQMPICDGYTATQRIRDIEAKAASPSIAEQRGLTEFGGGVPIFAVSASLHEHQKNQLLDCGFSGFILKPVDFSRLSELMQGVHDPAVRDAQQYQVGRWDKGGWLATSSRSSYKGSRSSIDEDRQ